MEKISSPSNGKIKYAVKIASSAKARRESGLFMLEGARLCEEGVRCGLGIVSLFITPRALELYGDRLAGALETAEESFEITPDIANKISDTVAPQGVFCICRQPENKFSVDLNGKYLALENLQDPSNLGAVSRTAEALGVSGLIISGGCDIFNPKAQRSGMGSLLRLPVIGTDDLPGLIRELRAGDMLTVASVPDQNAAPVTEISFDRGTVCVVGNEGNGLTDAVINACELRGTIPMKGNVESLNAATAASILMWEMTR
ncbi:MAG: RNA methyltransferase [Clostridiales bacterium]|nr:RNA methyltransferase [Clostridiales bacterium]